MKKLLLFILTIITNFQLFSKNISLEIDGASFKNDDNTVRWEMYYSFPDTMLAYKYVNGSYVGECYFSVQISSNLGIQDQKEWIVSYKSDSIVNKFKMNLLGMKPFVLPEGQYKVKLLIIDVNDTLTKAEKEFPLLINTFPKDRISISEIELAQTIETQEQASSNWSESFKKNSLIVVPNPSLEYVSRNPEVNVYTEIYGARTNSPDGYYINYTIFNSLNEKILDYRKSNSKSFSDGIVEIQNIPVEAYPSGVYFLQLEVVGLNKSEKNKAVISKKFYIINPEMPPEVPTLFTENQLFEKSEFSTLSEDRVKKEFEMIKTIATPYEVEVFDKCTDIEAKQRFLFRFWKSRDPDTTTLVNEALLKHRQKINYANTYFSYGKMSEGWRTDRGRVLLQYGFPTEREFTPVNGDNHAYETWFYSDVQGGVYFHFVDVKGYGNFILVNSTALGELRNDNWYDEYVPAYNPDAFQKKFQLR